VDLPLRLHLGKRVYSLLISLVAAYAILLLVVRLFESHLIFFPNFPDRLAGDWHPHGLPVQDVWLTSFDGIKLHAWWIPNSKARWTFLAFHGNAGNIADRQDIYEFLWNIPANVFALEYRGYGKSEGTPSESAFYRDADVAFTFLVKTEGVDRTKIISFGQSLGTAVAAALAAQNQVGGVVLEAPFPSASRLARKVYWFLPGVSLLVRGQFDTRRRLQETNVPVLIVQCTSDPVIPPQLGQEVFAEAHDPKHFLRINGYCHEEASVVAPLQYRSALDHFLSKIEDRNSSQAFR
jgi:uncharacterized protein